MDTLILYMVRRDLYSLVVSEKQTKDDHGHEEGIQGF